MRKVALKAGKQVARSRTVILPQISHCQQQPGEGAQVASFLRRDFQLLYAGAFIAGISADAQQPANGSRHAADNVLADAAGQVPIVVIGCGFEQFFGPIAGLAGVTDRPNIAFFDERRVVSPQAINQAHGEKRVVIFCVHRQRLPSASFGARQRRFKARLHRRIGIELGARGEGRILDEKLGFQYPQPVKLGKQQAGCF